MGEGGGSTPHDGTGFIAPRLVIDTGERGATVKSDNSDIDSRTRLFEKEKRDQGD
jgi:hypothetical protein